MRDLLFITLTAHLLLPSLSASDTFLLRHYKETAAPAKDLAREREGERKRACERGRAREMAEKERKGERGSNSGLI